MSRFFFHLFNDVEAVDEDGVEFEHLSAAMDKAADLARDMAAQSVRHGKLTLHHRIDVADAGGATVGTVYYRDVVEVRQ